MPVFRIEKKTDFTVIANHIFRNRYISLKAKGLLCQMLSHFDEWDYTVKGLTFICADGVDSINSGVKELEKHGYVSRERIRNKRGQLVGVEYVIREVPISKDPKQGVPKQENPKQAKPFTEKQPQLNTNLINTNTSSTDISNPYPSNPEGSSRMGLEWMGCKSTDDVRDLVYQNLEYHHLKVHSPLGGDSRLDEIAELIIEVLCSTKEIITVAGEDYPAPMVKERFLQISSSHIEYVIECLNRNTTYVRNIKRYLLATLFNAPSTIDSYYAAQVNHDLYHPNN